MATLWTAKKSESFDGDNSDDEDFGLSLRRRNSSSEHASNANDWHSSDDGGSTYPSLTGDECFDPLVLNEKYFNMCFNDLDTFRSGQKKKLKNRDISLKRDRHRSKDSKRDSREKLDTAELVLNEDEAEEAPIKTSGKGRKRSFTLLRALERDAKFKINDIIPASPEQSMQEPLAQIAAAPQQESLKIGCTSRFRSLKSKPVAAKECEQSSGAVTPVKASFVDCPKDRTEFYCIFSTLIRLGSSEKKPSEDGGFTRPVRALRQQKSHEELVWQNKLNDLLWLELRAWHNGRSISSEDYSLCQEREGIENVLNKVMNFKFIPATVTEGDEEYYKQDIFLDGDSNQEKSLKLNVDLALKESNRSGCRHPEGNSLIPPYSCSGYCSVFCEACLVNQNEALRQVSELLERLDNVERLYPSSRAMTKEWAIYKDEQFISRVQTMCLFWNLVTDLRQKIESLGKMLASLGGENLPWPTFTSHSCEKLAEDQVDVTPLNLSALAEAEEKRERRSSKCVRFRNCDRDTVSSSTSSGADSGLGLTNSSSSPSTTPLPTISSPRHLGVNPWSFDVASNKSPSTLYHSISEGSLDSSFMSPYRRYVDKVLKQKGLKKLLLQLTSLVQETLRRAQCTLSLQPVVDVQSAVSPDVKYFDYHAYKLRKGRGHHLLSSSSLTSHEQLEHLSQFGPFSPHYRNMELPSFRALYLFLLQIPIEIMHECVQLRLEQQPDEPSVLSIRQLMRECKETIKAAVIIRRKYVKSNQAVRFKHEQEKLEQELTDYDDNVKKMLQSYLRYLQSWVRMLLKSSQQTEKNVLEEEWAFVKAFSRYVQRGETLASEIFCSMASLMLDSAGLYLESGLDNCTTKLYDRMMSDANTSQRARANILQLCRDFKDVLHETRNRAVKAMVFSKMLRKDLEIAAEFDVSIHSDQLLEKLYSTSHVLLVAPHSSTFCIFIPDHIKSNLHYLGQLLSMTYGHENSAAPYDAESEGYLVIMCCERFGLKLDEWKGEKLMIEATAEITITLTHLKVEGLLFVVNHSCQMKVQKKIFQKAMESSVTLVKDYTTCNQSIADSLCDLKKEAMNLREKINDAIMNVEDKLNLDSNSDLDETEKANLQARCREILYQCYKFGFEYHKEMTYLVTGETREKLGLELIHFAQQWMKFVIDKCERGRGRRPRWATQGLEFLITACEPQNIKLLTSEEFLDLKQRLNTCISHLIGSPDSKSNIGSRPGSRSHSPTPHSRPGSFRHSPSYTEMPRSMSNLSNKLEAIQQQTTRNDLNSSIEENMFANEQQKSHENLDLFDGYHASLDPHSPVERVAIAMKCLEDVRERKLQKDGVIGKVVDKVVETSVQISARKVTFRWQRGIKLGQGRFGKVYTAVNSCTGELMALKEIHLQPNDHKTIKEVADELKIFEGIRNPHLVRYYGIEIHREEMFIFMEYCESGTLENALQLALPEPQIRKYTRQLLLAVSVLHDHGIVHRDIKGANIFLTSDGNLKLGDFGCCIKLKNHTTMPGEVSSFVGTQAYMAPEVFTKTAPEGQGRASDIWSLGCVVVEMAQGKRPWFELENHYQIMYKVGMGETPEIPDNLSDEGQDFLNSCFKFIPKERSTAIELLGHPFTKVFSEDDYQSMPFLLS